MEGKTPVLAKYDFRTKQQYIYRTNQIKEIAGASALITDAYDDFLNVLAEKGWKIAKHYELAPYPYRCYQNMVKDPFDPDLQANEGEVIYVGGGNLYMIWRDKETALKANRILSAYLREKTYSLSPVCGITEYTGDYAKDLEALNNDFDRMKGTVPPVLFSAILPFTQTDRKTGMPIIKKAGDGGEPEDLSAESDCKLRKYRSFAKNNTEDVQELDRLITEKGTESLLAVIYIDGNNMGARVGSKMKTNGRIISDYPEAVKTIRDFSNSIQDIFVSKPRKAIEQMLKESKKGYRFVIAGGDEITLICNARYALKAVRTYFDELDKTNSTKEPYNTACAGICIFHSHYPFSTAYAIAEECCENAKKSNREHGGNNCLVDFQHCFGGNIGTLDIMRENDVKGAMMRPYLYKHYGEEDAFEAKTGRLDIYMERAEKLAKFNRTNLKNLASLKIAEPERYEKETKRLKARIGIEIDATDEKYLHDIAQFYDIWF